MMKLLHDFMLDARTAEDVALTQEMVKQCNYLRILSLSHTATLVLLTFALANKLALLVSVGQVALRVSPLSAEQNICMRILLLLY